ncbi:MAG: proline dehydrogenase family protein [Gammaproteobacteria bacterium]|nr:proline dehydrogenase family protein [Gammaproteobacteria bacterium]
MAAIKQKPDLFQLQIESCGQRLANAVSNSISKSYNPYNWLEQLINRTISEPDFRIQALRFIDVLPSLDDDSVLVEHLQEYFSDLPLPLFAEWGLKHSDTPWATLIAVPTVRYTLKRLARKFMGGEQLHQAISCITQLRHQNMNFTLDLLGEATISEVESEAYQQQYLQMLDSLSKPIDAWSHHTLLDTSHDKESPRLNLSIKLSSLYSQINPAAPQSSINAICKQLRPILRAAIKNKAFITIDMEQYDIKNIVLDCFRQIIMEDEFRAWPHIGLALQSYLKETYDDIKNLIALLSERGTPVTIRLVRGAYWDYETVIAQQNNWPCPVWQNKNETNQNFEKCLILLLNSHKKIHTAIASHNLRSIAFAMALIEKLNLQRDQFEFQMLYGMSDYLKPALVELGYRLRIYVPFGETLPGMSYLVRRLLENSSGQSMLESGFGEQSNLINSHSFDERCSDPEPRPLKKNEQLTFKNTPFLRFTSQQQCSDFEHQIMMVKAQLGDKIPLIINGKEIFTEHTIQSYNPAKPAQLIGQVSSANQQHANEAIQASLQAFKSWKNVPIQQRADYLRQVALLLTERRMEFAAWQIFEAGKNWQEADGDVCEAIDFLNYYAQQAEHLAIGTTNNISGENNYLNYKPKGISLVIPPWNFPLAILCGMLSASIVTGNTCILKPSSLTPVIASKFMQLWQEVMLPTGVINFLPGSGEIIGDYLAHQPEINIIAFTGSLEVGTKLLSIGNQIQPGQHQIKKIITEMGGKNAIIIDHDADLDEAVLGVVHSAFGFQGQKCSAASRVIVVGHIYEKFIRRLIEATRSLTIGSPEEPGHLLGPVIDEKSYKRILQSIKNGQLVATLHNYEENKNTQNGYYIKPCIFTDVDPLSPLAQEEIFGPVLCVIKAENFKQSVEIANNTRYALTGGVYSRQPSHLQYARENFNVGNLYLNRKITGALVSRQPFGGFKMSGSGSKAGGTEYLLQFMDCYCTTENTLRRGFAPDHKE